MTQDRINEIRAIMDRAKEYQGINYALERAVYELIAEVKRLQTSSDHQAEQKGNW